jgi:hypothetical protein
MGLGSLFWFACAGCVKLWAKVTVRGGWTVGSKERESSDANVLLIGLYSILAISNINIGREIQVVLIKY